MNLQSTIDAATNPQVAVPIATAGAVANWLETLPHIVALGWLVYIVILIGHKVWKWRQEWMAVRDE